MRYELLDVNDDYVLTPYPDHVMFGARKAPGGGRVLWRLQPTPKRWWWPLQKTEVPSEGAAHPRAASASRAASPVSSIVYPFWPPA